MSIRTSRSHPLGVQWVEVPGVPGRIGMTFCPGKVQPTSMTGGWRRDLGADLETLRALGVRALVCLVEEWELRALEVETLGADARARGFEFHHLPIVDQCAPDASFEQAWVEAGARLRALLSAGDRIVAFCKGGLGRTGTIAARLLVEHGMTPAAAIAAVRAARPLTVETAAQEAYLHAMRPPPPRAGAGTPRSGDDAADAG